MSTKKLTKINKLINEAIRIYDSDADWELKYDLIFDMYIWRKIRNAGYHFEWYDPDTSYEEDVRYYVNALREFQEKIGNLV